MADTFWTEPPMAIAHRGGAGLFSRDRFRKENTLSVFKAAVKLGYKYLELDVTNTADNKVIVLHVTADKFEALLRKPSAPDAQKMQRYTYTQLKKRLGRDIPTLEETLKEFPKTKFLIDTKTDEVVEPVAKIIKKTKVADRVYLNSFFVERVEKLQRLLGPEINCGVIVGRHPRWMNQRLRLLKRGDYFGKGFSAITVPKRFLSRRIVRLVHQHGIKVLTWGHNNEDQIRRATKFRVDGIISDNAGLLIKTIK